MDANFRETLIKVEMALKLLQVCERMGITPEQVMEWADAVESGYMVMLPCKPGDDVYWLDNDWDGEKDVWRVKCDKRGVGAVVVRGKDDFAIIGRDSVRDCDVEEIGDRWSFLTEEDAQAAIERMNNDG